MTSVEYKPDSSQFVFDIDGKQVVAKPKLCVIGGKLEVYFDYEGSKAAVKKAQTFMNSCFNELLSIDFKGSRFPTASRSRIYRELCGIVPYQHHWKQGEVRDLSNPQDHIDSSKKLIESTPENHFERSRQA